MSRSNEFSPEQSMALLSVISHSAGQIAALAERAGDIAGGTDELDALTVAISVLARRVGWFSDVALAGLKGSATSMTDAQYWLMPPSCWPQTATPQGGSV